MRFLADAGISPHTVSFLGRLGHEVAHVRALGMQRAPDVEITDRARADAAVVLTFDLDFGDVLALGVLDKPSVIIFRLADERPGRGSQRTVCRSGSRRAHLGRRHAVSRSEIADWAADRS